MLACLASVGLTIPLVKVDAGLLGLNLPLVKVDAGFLRLPLVKVDASFLGLTSCWSKLMLAFLMLACLA